MQAAVNEVRKQLGKNYPLVINGRSVNTTEWIDSLNPSHIREVVGKCAKATVDHANDALKAAAEAFPKWRDTDPNTRADYLVKAAEVMRRRKFELAAWEVFECAKQWREADADVAEAIDFCEYYAAEMRRLAARHAIVLP